jgi:acyl-CoA synthetase (AMP-forming)/AMP-acid ligase II/acyl carrier protein
MAEATVFIAGPVPNSSDPKVISIDAQALQEGKIIQANKDSQKIKKLVGCGKAWLDEKIIIVNPQSFAQSPVNCVGEIWVSGANVAQGYWNQPELTRAVFQASLLDTGEGPFLRTGDLGFIQDDQLFITGRLRDLIIIRGRNFYPQDIEQAVESSHKSLRPTGGAAFAIDIDGQEQLVIVQEVERAYTRNLDAKAIFKAILQVQDIQPYAVVLIKHGSIAKTSSGKVQRHICKENFLNGNLVILEQWFKHHQKFIESPNEITLENIQSYLVQKLANYSGLTIDDIELEESFAAYGLDSSFAVTIAEDLSTMFDCQVSPLLFWQYQNIKDLAEFIASEYIVS